MRHLILSAALISSTPLWGQTSGQESPGDLLGLLGLIDTPVTKADLERVAGDGAEKGLQRIALDPTAQTLHRQRAAQALSSYPSPESEDAMMKLATHPHAALRKSGVMGLSRYLDDPRVLTFVLAALEDSEVSIRKAAIRLLSDKTSARPALEKRLRVETDRNARALLTSTLKQ